MAESRAAVRAAGRRLLRRGARGVGHTVARRSRMLAFLALLGPGMIAASAGNDAGGVATYSEVGARYGYTLLWAMVLITVLRS